MTPLFYCVQRPTNLAITQYFIDLGLSVNHKSVEGSTPLHLAAAFLGCDQQIQLLVKHGALIDSVDSQGSTPAHYALIKQNISGYQTLKELGANIQLKNLSDITPDELYQQWLVYKQQNLNTTSSNNNNKEEEEEEELNPEELAQLKICSESSCGKREKKPNTFKRCSKCKAVNCCSQSCQLRDWKLGHKKKCATLAATTTKQQQ